MTMRAFLCIVLAGQLSVGLAASPAIGVVTASGQIHLNDARVDGNGTLFEGTNVATGLASGQLRLDNGVRMRLASSSRGTLYRDRLVLESGAGSVETAGDYRIEAMGLRIAAEAPGSAAQVAMKDTTVEVAALRGAFRVVDGDGIVLATMPAGRALAFDVTRSGASAPSTVAGCVREEDGHYLLEDETSGAMFELRGEEVADHVGHEVSLTGVVVPSAKAAKGANQVLQVSSLEKKSERCSSGGLAAAGAGAAGVGAATAGGGATTAVIAGVIVAAAGTGAVIGLTRNEEEPQTISR